jgi:uncharacterized protein
MEIQQQNTDTKGHFYIEADGNEADGNEAASMHYVWAGDNKIIIDHTEVAEAFEGRGLGKQLMQAIVLFARGNNIKIIPLCPFAKSMFDKVAEYRDVLA